MKKVAFFLIVFTVLFFSSCSIFDSEQTLPTSPSSNSQIPPTNTSGETDDNGVKEGTSPLEISFSDYEFLYTDERDRNWEEDVVYLARLFLGEYPAKGHPLLRDREAVTLQLGNYLLGYFYTEESRIQFIDDIQFLISRIPELSDTEILYEIQRIVAGLSDSHSRLYLPASECFTLLLQPFYTENGVALRAVRLPSEYGDLLYARLTAINGIPIEQVIERLSNYIPRECDAGMMESLTSTIYSTGLLYRKDALQVIGVVGAEDDTAQFEFVTDHGEHISVELSAVTTEEQAQIDMALGDWFSSDTFSYEHMIYTYYWYKLYEESGAIYLRFNIIMEMSHYPITEFFQDIENDLVGSQAEVVIIDLRFTPGGAIQNFDFVEAVCQLDMEKVYVLIDGSSQSGAPLLAAELLQGVPNAVLVGQPAGQPPNFFADARKFTLPNSQISFAVSDMWYCYWPDYAHETLMPDILIYQTLEDYMNGVDTVLAFVLANGNQ